MFSQGSLTTKTTTSSRINHIKIFVEGFKTWYQVMILQKITSCTCISYHMWYIWDMIESDSCWQGFTCTVLFHWSQIWCLPQIGKMNWIVYFFGNIFCYGTLNPPYYPILLKLWTRTISLHYFITIFLLFWILDYYA